MQACGLGIREASQSQRRSQELAAALAAGQLCPLRFRHAVRRSSVRQFGMWRMVAFPHRDQSRFPAPDFGLSISRISNLTRPSLRMRLNKQSRPLTNPTVSQVSQSSPLRLCSLACLGPLPCSPFLATIIGEYTLSRYILGGSHVSPRACVRLDTRPSAPPKLWSFVLPYPIL
jgi:hypothetical protein